MNVLAQEPKAEPEEVELRQDVPVGDSDRLLAVTREHQLPDLAGTECGLRILLVKTGCAHDDGRNEPLGARRDRYVEICEGWIRRRRGRHGHGRWANSVANDVAVLARGHPSGRLDHLGVAAERPHRQRAVLRPAILVEQDRIDAAVGAGGETHWIGGGKLGDRKGNSAVGGLSGDGPGAEYWADRIGRVLDEARGPR